MPRKLLDFRSLTITVPKDMEQEIRRLVGDGKAESVSDYIRRAVRLYQKKDEEMTEGLARKIANRVIKYLSSR